jgi:hypothetical protein
MGQRQDALTAAAEWTLAIESNNPYPPLATYLVATVGTYGMPAGGGERHCR